MSGWDETVQMIEAAPDGWGDGWEAAADAAMPLEATETGHEGIVALCARPEAEALQGVLLAAMGQPGDVAFDAGAVERLDVPAMQVLLAAMLDLKRRGDRLVAVNPSFAFGLAFEALGFSGETEAFTVEYR